MITFEEAFQIVISSAFETGTEIIPFMESPGRILAEKILSDVDMPPFNRSAVDGYACHREDLDNDLEVIEVLAAGQVPGKIPVKNQCSKIMTGAIVPDHCDMVFMVEDSAPSLPGKVRFTGNNPKTNISFRGEDVRAGDIVMEPPGILRPQDIAVMASVGHISVKVRKKPEVAIISTGDELVEPSEVPAISKIRNSNAYQLLAQVSRAGGTGKYYGIAPDKEDLTYEVIKRAINENNVVILTGGVSMGDFDFVPAVLERAGVKILFDKVSVQPGKPTTFGIHPKALIFGLPGNPVSSFVQFETLIRPLINKMMGYEWKPRMKELPMASRYVRKSADRMGWIPVRVNDKNQVDYVEYHGSAHITSLPDADGIIALKTGNLVIEKGEIVSVREI